MLLLFFRWCCLFFFFKQKTAYEVRISDWSSDVCSSDLLQPPVGFDIPQRRGAHRVVAAVERQVDTVRSLAVAKAEYGAELRVESAETFLQMGDRLFQHVTRIGRGAALVVTAVRRAPQHQHARVPLPPAGEGPVPTPPDF